MRMRMLAAALAAAFPAAVPAQETPAPAKDLGVVTITGGRPSSLPTQVPATMEGVTREQIGQAINATDSEDALKYLPSLLVRKRYAGDYNHAVLSSRASGTGNSARSAVYADGILLSNFLGNGVGGLGFPPRWGLVTPEEIERVDVMYGPFSAAYPGNSVGAAVEYVTRMPTRFEAHAKVGYVLQPFELYGRSQTLHAKQASAALGNKAGDWAWWFDVGRTDSEGQPLTFATRLVSQLSPAQAAGAAMDRNTANQPVYVVAAGTQYHTVQDHAKAKLAYDVSPTVRASYVLGWWQNTSTNQPTAYLRNPSVLTGADLPVTDESLTHFMHGFSLQSHTQGTFDWALAASLYDYARDLKRQNAAGNVPPGALAGGPGTVADGGGTGWHTLAARGTWRPEGTAGAHIADFGVQQDTYVLKYRTSAIAGNYLANAPGALVSDVGGRTQLASLWAQDAWRFAPAWKAVLGLRGEQWTASRGVTRIPGAAPAVDAAWPERREFHASPKAALSWQWQADTVLKAALGRAVRFPTVGELYGATSTVNARYVNDPNLRPEKSWTGELTAEKDLGNGLLRLTLFAENTRDALYAQTLFDTVANLNVSRVQNVGRIETRGLEVAYNASDVVWKGFDLQASATYADSTIKENAGFVTVPGDTAGKRQPNIPRLRTALLASYRWSERFSTSVGARSSSPQFRTLNNADINGFTYMGVSRFFVVDLRAQWKIDKTFTAAFGIDNLNNDKYWNFHPYPQRSFFAELKADL